MAGDWRDQLKRLQQRKELLVIILFLFVIIVFWIVISLIASQQTVGTATEQQRLARPLNPALDIAVIEELELKRSYDDIELGGFQILTLPGLEFSVESTQPLVEPAQVEPTEESAPAEPEAEEPAPPVEP